MRSLTYLLFALVATTNPILGWTADGVISGKSRLNLAPPEAQASYYPPPASLPPRDSAHATARYREALAPAFAGPRTTSTTSRWISGAAVAAIAVAANLRGAQQPDNAYMAGDIGWRAGNTPNTGYPYGAFAGSIR